MNNANQNKTSARLATLDELRENLLPAHIAPLPCKATLKTWLDNAQVPRMKCNATAKRGGGRLYYSVAHVERFLRSRMLPGKIQVKVGEL